MAKLKENNRMKNLMPKRTFFTDDEIRKEADKLFNRIFNIKHGSPSLTHRSDIEYLLIKTKKTESCWVWQGPFNTQGYGVVSSRKYLSAHRLSWYIHYGEIPNGLLICHKCDNPPCVNPEHLFLGTHKDNIHDMINKGRQRKNKEYYLNMKASSFGQMIINE